MTDEEMRILIWLMKGCKPEDRPPPSERAAPPPKSGLEARWDAWRFRWDAWLFLWLRRWERFACGRLGLHTYVEKHDLDMERGTITYGGWRCIDCDEPAPLG